MGHLFGDTTLFEGEARKIMKLNGLLRILVAGLVLVTMPITQAYPAIPSTDAFIQDIAESADSHEIHIPGNQQGNVEEGAEVPTEDLLPSRALIPNEILQEETQATVEEIEDDSDEDKDKAGAFLLLDHDQHFWTSKKIWITTSIVLSTGLLLGLLLLLAAGGGGSGSSSGAGVGGGDGGALDFGLGGIPGGGDLNELFSPLSGNNPSQNPENLTDTGEGDPNNGGDPSGGNGNGDENNPPSDQNIPPAGGGGGPTDDGVTDFVSPPIDTNLPHIPGTGIPHNPEPSTFLLLGLGLLLPFFRKKGI